VIDTGSVAVLDFKGERDVPIAHPTTRRGPKSATRTGAKLPTIGAQLSSKPN